MVLTAPRYAIVCGVTHCYQCGHETPVIAFALPPESRADDEEPYEHGWLNAINIAELPASAESRLRSLPGGANYKADFSIMAGERYVINHCGEC